MIVIKIINEENLILLPKTITQKEMSDLVSRFPGYSFEYEDLSEPDEPAKPSVKPEEIEKPSRKDVFFNGSRIAVKNPDKFTIKLSGAGTSTDGSEFIIPQTDYKSTINNNYINLFDNRMIPKSLAGKPLMGITMAEFVDKTNDKVNAFVTGVDLITQTMTSIADKVAYIDSQQVTLSREKIKKTISDSFYKKACEGLDNLKSEISKPVLDIRSIISESSSLRVNTDIENHFVETLLGYNGFKNSELVLMVVGGLSTSSDYFFKSGKIDVKEYTFRTVVIQKIQELYNKK